MPPKALPPAGAARLRSPRAADRWGSADRAAGPSRAPPLKRSVTSVATSAVKTRLPKEQFTLHPEVIV